MLSVISGSRGAFAPTKNLKAKPQAKPVRFAGSQGDTFESVLKRVVPATATIQVQAKLEPGSPPPGLSGWLERKLFPVKAPSDETVSLQKGSGFWIRCRDGKPRLLTNAHVVTVRREMFRVNVPSANSVKYVGELNFHRDYRSAAANRQEKTVALRLAKAADGASAASRREDLALLEPVDDKFYVKTKDGYDLPDGIQPLPFAELDKAPPGTPVFKIGSGNMVRGTIAEGIVSAYRSRAFMREEDDDQPETGIVIESTAPLNTGDSGGPLLDRNGNVLGVNFSIPVSTNRHTAVQGVSWSISAPDAIRLLRKWGFVQ